MMGSGLFVRLPYVIRPLTLAWFTDQINQPENPENHQFTKPPCLHQDGIVKRLLRCGAEKDMPMQHRWTYTPVI